MTMFPFQPSVRDIRPSNVPARDERFNRRLCESDWLKHLCGFDIALFDAIQAVEHQG